MIRWNDIQRLHVIAKLAEIVDKWYGVDLYWANPEGQMGRTEGGEEHPFLQAQKDAKRMDLDVAKMAQHYASGNTETIVFDSAVSFVKGAASPLIIDGRYRGTVFAGPFVTSPLGEKERTEIASCPGISAAAIEHLRVCSEVEHLKDLVELAAREIVEFSCEMDKREDQIKDLHSELGQRYRYHSMIGKSKNMQQIYRLLEKISKAESSVFIQGDNGTGKELVAKAVHYSSPRKDKTFLAINCSAFNENLLDSELFGHVKGAFTGALKDKKGLFEQADGGTLFLDEIGDTAAAMQVKLLRVLQEGTFLPVGATEPRSCDVRIIAATNKPIKEMMQKGEFREDLFYRINVINISLPTLKERSEDIPLLIEHFMKKRCDESGLPLKNFSKEAMEKMLDYHWPGNVRELQNEVERVVVLAGDNKTIPLDLLSLRIVETHQGHPGLVSAGQDVGIKTTGKLRDAQAELGRLMIGQGLMRCNFNKSKLARELGISRASLISKVERYGLDKRAHKKAA